MEIDTNSVKLMRNNSYDDQSDYQHKLNKLIYAKNLFFTLGLILTAISLITFGFAKIAESKNQIINYVLLFCVALNVATFLAIVPVHNKVRCLKQRNLLKSKK